MGTISLNDVAFTAGVTLFQNLNLVVGDGDRIGLVAMNGGGKSTLLRGIAGQQEPSQGAIVASRGLRIGYVEQDVPERLQTLTLREAVADALAPDIRETETWRVDVALDGFETPDDLRDRPVGKLSGGWKRLMLIARVWVNEPDALLLDEPTNHLDLEKILRLETWLATEARRMPVLVASHDRAFLDTVTNRTLFLRPQRSEFFPLPFSKAREALAQQDAAAEIQFGNDLKEANKLRKQAAKLTNIGVNSGSDLLTTKAKQLKDRAAKIEDQARPAHKERGAGDIRLSNSGTHARVMLAFDDVAVETPAGDLLFRTGKLHVFQGDRIVLLGRNGVGKTQLVRLIHRAVSGDPPAGVRAATSLVVGHMDQELSDLPAGATPWEVVGRFRLPDQRSRALLAGAGFPVDRQDRPLSAFSFGQRARLALLALRLTEPNFYLLDEPTNHIDIAGCEALESEILAHGATAVLVSHDRTFVRNTGTRFLLIEGRRLTEVDSPEPFFAAMAE